MYGGINRNNLGPRFEDTKSIREQASIFLRNKNLLNEIRKAYLKGYIDRQELLTLRGQTLNGDSDGAEKGLARLTGRIIR